MQETKLGFTRLLARYIAGTTFGDLPNDVAHQAKRLILDVIGCTLGGYLVDPAPMLRELVEDLGGTPESTILGSGRKTSCVNATYVNAKTANILDFDDTFGTLTHFGVTAVLTPLSLCEREGASGKDLVTAVALGFDLAARVDVAVGNPYMVEDGMKPNMARRCMRQGAVLSAAASAGKAIALSEDQMAQAIGIAVANMPFQDKYLSGTPFFGSVPHFKGVDHGWCGMTGLTAALLAQKGFTAYPTILDEPSGFWKRFPSTEKDFDLLVGRLGEKWYITDTSFKLWPACSWTLPPLTAFSKVMRENDLRMDEIQKVTVYGTPHLSSPRFSTPEYQDALSSQFNIPHTLAMVAMRLPAGPEWYMEKALRQPLVQEFKKKVFCQVHPESRNIGKWVEEGQVRKIPAKVEVVAKGKTYTCEVEYSKGDPWSPETYATDDELRQKLGGAVSSLAPCSESLQEKIDDIADRVYRLEEAEDVRELTKLLSWGSKT